MTDASGNARNAVTYPFGYYRFAGVAAGATCVISARGNLYSFSQPTQVVTVIKETEINFVAEPLN